MTSQVPRYIKDTNSESCKSGTDCVNQMSRRVVKYNYMLTIGRLLYPWRDTILHIVNHGRSIHPCPRLCSVYINTSLDTVVGMRNATQSHHCKLHTLLLPMHVPSFQERPWYSSGSTIKPLPASSHRTRTTSAISPVVSSSDIFRAVLNIDVIPVWVYSSAVVTRFTSPLHLAMPFCCFRSESLGHSGQFSAT